MHEAVEKMFFLSVLSPSTRMVDMPLVRTAVDHLPFEHRYVDMFADFEGESKKTEVSRSSHADYVC